MAYFGLASLWGLAVYFALSISDKKTNWDTTFCGVWGCSAPIAAVISCHLVWGLFLLPFAVIVCAKCSKRVTRITGMTTVCVAVSAILVLVVYEYFHWYRFVQPAYRIYFGRRIALSLFSQIDFPILPLLLTGLGVWWVSLLRPDKVLSRAEQEDGQVSEEVVSS